MRRTGVTGLLLVGTFCCAQAQVYVGQSAEGAIVLSSSVNEDATTLLIEAEKQPSEAAPDKAVSAAFITTVPGVYWPFILEASNAYLLPSELIHAVISVESNYNPRAISPKGAQGLMQLMPATAKRFGNTNTWDPRQNILAGSKYLRWLLDFFDQNVELAVAAYNAGESAVVHAGRKIPQITETEKYVPKVMSIYKKSKRLT